MAKASTTEPAGEAETATSKDRRISVNGVFFTLDDKYSAGYAINALEAQALNQTRAENIGNNFRKKVKDKLGERKTLEASEIEELQTEFNKVAAEYVFSAAGGRVTDPIEKECKRIASDILDGKLAEKGIVKSKYEKYDAQLSILMANSAIRAKAEAAVAERNAMASSIEFG